ncbi:MAG: hypothetical protein V4714_22655 [Bacteroidota bacterium]
MVKKCLLLFIYLSFFSSSTFANELDNIWHQGVVVLRSGDVFSGDVYYDYHTEVVQCKSGELTKAFAASQVKYFSFQDTEIASNRRFIPLVFQPKPGYRYESFFEVISTGTISLYRRHGARKHLMANPKFMQVNRELGFSNEIIGFDYYTKSQNGLKKIANFKKEFFPRIMKEYGTAIESFIHENRLRLYQQANQIIVLQYYNYLNDALRIKLDAENSVANH